MENNIDKIKKLRHLLKIRFNKKVYTQYSNNKTIEDNIEELLLDILPHGSGIDCDWEFIWYTNGNLDCTNEYHAMWVNKDNYYIGYIPFKVKFFQYKKDVLNRLHKGKIQIIAKKGDIDYKIYAPNHDYRSYGLKDYLQDTISYALEKF